LAGDLCAEGDSVTAVAQDAIDTVWRLSIDYGVRDTAPRNQVFDDRSR
jgi:hypothetical protein